MRTLESIAEISGGGTPSRTNPTYFGGGISWATPTDVTALRDMYIERTKETLTEAGLKGSSANLLPPGAVLLTSRATIGYTAVAKVPICTNQGFVNFKCGPELEPEYLAYWLRSIKPLLERLANGATFKEISRGTVRKLEIELPNRIEQRRVVDLLSRADNIVRMRREAEQKAKEIIPALFLDMFGDPATNPKGWKVRNLPNVLSEPFKNGLYLSKEHYADEGTTDGVEMIHMSDAFYGEVRRGKLRRVTATTELLKPYLLTHYDLLVARRSLNWEGAAKLCRLPPSNEPIVFESSFIRLRPDPEQLETDYLYYYMNSPRTRAAFVE